MLTCTYISLPLLSGGLQVREDGRPALHDGFVEQVPGQWGQNLEREHRRPSKVTQGASHPSHATHPFFKENFPGRLLKRANPGEQKVLARGLLGLVVKVWASYITSLGARLLVNCEVEHSGVRG